MQHGPSGESNNKSNDVPELRHTKFSKFFGTALGALGEQVFFHPVDTVAKTSMAKNLNIFPWLSELVRKEGLTGTSTVLYRGFILGYGKKAPLRVYKYGVQDELAERMTLHFGVDAQTHFGDYGHVAIQTGAGAVTGIFEPVFFQWIDTLQVRKQVLGEKISYSNATSLGWTGLYRGSLVTGLGRNAPGAAGLFGGSELANHLMDNKDHHSDAKNLLAKWGGAFMSLVFSQPGDVIKTRMQVQQITFTQAIKGISLGEVLTSGLGARLFMSAKVGAGFLLIEKCMNLSKEWFGERGPRSKSSPPSTPEVSSPQVSEGSNDNQIDSATLRFDVLLEKQPALLQNFDSKTPCPFTDMAVNEKEDFEMAALSERASKMKV